MYFNEWSLEYTGIYLEELEIRDSDHALPGHMLAPILSKNFDVI
jgi:hypothetical protein